MMLMGRQNMARGKENGKMQDASWIASTFAADTGQRPANTISEPMYVGYAKEFQLSERLESENRLLRAINRFIVYYLGAYFCDLDLEASRCNQTAAGVARRSKPDGGSHQRQLSAFIGRLGGLHQSKWKRRLRFGWIPKALLVCFCLFQAYLFAATYYQYQYDFDVLRLLELQRRQAGGGGGSGSGGGGVSWQQQQVRIQSRMAETKTTLDWLGSDYSHLTILVECFYLVIAALTLIMYLPLYVHHRFQEPFDKCHIVRDLLDRPRELDYSRLLVERQVAKFIESSRVYHENIIAFPDTPLGAWQADPARVAAVAEHSQPTGGPSKASKREREIFEMTRDMLACGALTPLYRMRTWAQRRTLMEFCYHLGQTAFTFLFHMIFMGGFISLAKDSEKIARAESRFSTQVTLQVATLGPLIIASPNMIVHPPLIIVVTNEHIRYINQLRRMIQDCIARNSAIVGQLGRRHRLQALHQAATAAAAAAASGGHGEIQVDDSQLELLRHRKQSTDASGTWQFRGLERTVNSNIIFVLLHYKIFVTHLTPMRHSLGVKFLVALSLLFTVPLITRIHQPYLRKLYEGRLTDGQIKIFAFVISSSVLLPINLVCMPVCHMFACCKCLYRDLASLMAHISEVEMHAMAHERGGRANIYDSHTQSCLLKELSDSKRLLEQLTVRAGGISGTYTNLIKALLWFGLIAISILAESGNSGGGGGGGGGDDNQGELLSGLFSDPLGVYSEIN